MRVAAGFEFVPAQGGGDPEQTETPRGIPSLSCACYRSWRLFFLTFARGPTMGVRNQRLPLITGSTLVELPLTGLSFRHVSLVSGKLRRDVKLKVDLNVLGA